MSAKYLIRFDDICPTMNWGIWDQIEYCLKSLEINPILAVIPDNQDPKLKVHEANPDFWSRVRAWQAMGWTIGLHGYQHKYETNNAGIVGLNKYSEFAGLSIDVQRRKINKAIDILKKENVRPELWIAPAHSFDESTLQVLKSQGIKIISDGMFVNPVRDRNGFTWIPQQMWRFRKMPFGVWTICYHPNDWEVNELLPFKRDITKYKRFIVHVNHFKNPYRVEDCGFLDMASSKLLLMSTRLRRTYRRLSGGVTTEDGAN